MWYAFSKLWWIFYVSVWPRNTWFLLSARFLSTYVYTSVCSRVAVDTITLFVAPPLRLFFFPWKMCILLELLDSSNGPIGCPEMSLRNYNSTLLKNPRRAKISSSYRLIPFLRILQFGQCLVKFFHLYLTLNRRFSIFLISITFVDVKNSPEGTVSFILTYLPHTSSPLHFYSFLNLPPAYDWNSASPNTGGGGFRLSNPVIIPRNF
jgi:hypothetical protein